MFPEFWLFPSFFPLNPGLCCSHRLKCLNLTSTSLLLRFKMLKIKVVLTSAFIQ